jgi:hypothetical protein
LPYHPYRLSRHIAATYGPRAKYARVRELTPTLYSLSLVWGKDTARAMVPQALFFQQDGGYWINFPHPACVLSWSFTVTGRKAALLT